MREFPVQITRPTTCPFCSGRAVDTLAKVITAATLWQCRKCDGQWTIAGLSARSGR